MIHRGRVCVLSAFSGRAGKRFCARRVIGLRHQPDGFPGGQKISGLLFKISGSDFKIRATNFFLAPMWGKRTENQFSFFPPKNARFTTRVLRRRSSLPGNGTAARQPATHSLYIRHNGFNFQTFFYFVLFIRQIIHIFVLHAKRNHEQNYP